MLLGLGIQDQYIDVFFTARGQLSNESLLCYTSTVVTIVTIILYTIEWRRSLHLWFLNNITGEVT